MNGARWRGRIGAAVLTAAIALPACGGDDEGEAEALSADDWTARADRYCTDGTQEAIALPLPASSREVGPDAAARAEIVATVRDGLLTLGRPGDIDSEQLDAFLGELETDIGQLEQSAEAGDGPVALDESAGVAANEMGLPGCAAFVNAIARTP